MPNYFPPSPVYPKNYDSDETLFLVHNTAETLTSAENLPWAEEVDIVPVAADAIEKLNVPIKKVVIVGGAARNKAVQEIASTFFNFDIAIPEPGEYVALGAAKQAAWALSGKESAPDWAGSNVEHLAKSGTSHHLYEEYKLLIQGNSN